MTRWEQIAGAIAAVVLLLFSLMYSEMVLSSLAGDRSWPAIIVRKYFETSIHVVVPILIFFLVTVGVDDD